MLHRRDAMLRLGQLGLGALTLPTLLRAEGTARGKAKAGILVFLWGGPPQQDLWDLKPGAPEGVRGPYSPIRTNVPGILIGEKMPLLARRMDKVAVLRSVTHKSDIHEPSVYHMLTGKTDNTLVVPRNQRRRSHFPNFPAVLSSFLEPGTMPTTATIPRPIGHDGVTYAGTHAGFLGARHDPMELREAPNSGTLPTHPVALPSGMDATRLQARRGLLHHLEQHDRAFQHSRVVRERSDFTEQAFRMLSNPRAKRAFNLDLEPTGVRERYGRNEYGDSFLLSRRLVEAGVRLVSIIWMYIFPNGRVSNVWDNHAGYGIHGAKTGYDLLNSPVCIPPLDRGLSALLDDLSDRGLLDETLVTVMGEFGRTPKINKDAGRDHWGACQSVLLAGGGVRGGQVYGASDATAAYPRDNPVSPEDLLATIYHGFGLPPDAEVHDQENRPHRVVTGKAVTALFA